MRRSRSLVAVLLLALWLPVTMCCEMEMAGVWPECGACDGEKASTAVVDECDVDSRGMLESGSVRVQPHVQPLKALDFAEYLLPAARLEDRLPPAVRDRTAARPEWIHSWQFVRRAAPRSRAPSFMV